MKRSRSTLLTLFLAFLMVLSACGQEPTPPASVSRIPPFDGKPYVELNGNQPEFSEEDLTTEPFETYSPLDALNRCGVAYANICLELMPTEDRGTISQIRPSGWHTVKYDVVDGKYLYNRCHLIGFQLAGENANNENLITGTRYLNVTGMLPFENMVADFVQETEQHVLYRVTPVFEGDELVARGVQIEALSVEDEGDGICFNVYVYNNQPGVEIDYATGESWLIGEEGGTSGETEAVQKYILNTDSKTFHLPDCSVAKRISDRNRETCKGTRDQMLNKGYTPCEKCKP